MKYFAKQEAAISKNAKLGFEQPREDREEKKMESNQVMAVPLFCAPIGTLFFCYLFCEAEQCGNSGS
jgi:hypothetical protein